MTEPPDTFTITLRAHRNRAGALQQLKLDSPQSTDDAVARLESLRGRRTSVLSWPVELEDIKRKISQRLRVLNQLHGSKELVDSDGELSDFDSDYIDHEDIFADRESIVSSAALLFFDIFEYSLNDWIEYVITDDPVATSFLEARVNEADDFCQFLQGVIESDVKDLAYRLDDNVLVARRGLYLFEIVDLLRQAIVERTDSARARCLEIPLEEDTREDQDNPAEHESQLKKDDTGTQSAVHLPNSGAQEPPVEGYLAGDESAQNGESDQFGAQPQQEQRSRKFWSHITLSRDQTASSDFRKELLSVLRASKLELGGQEQRNSLQNPGAVAAQLSGTELTAYQKQVQQYQTQTLRVHQQVLTRHNIALQYQRNRLEGIRRAVALQSSLDLAMSGQAAPQPPHEGATQHSASTQHAEPKVCELLERISRLEAENKTLRTDQVQEPPPSFRTFFFIQDSTGHLQSSVTTSVYLEEPSWSIGPKGEVGLKAHFPVTDIEAYILEQPSISFVIAKFYSSSFQNDEVQAAIRNKRALPRPEPYNETIRLQSQDMVEAAEHFFGRQPNFSSEFPDFNIRSQILAPYLFWYHYRSPEAFFGLSEAHRYHMELLTGWIEKAYGVMYSRVEDQLKRGVVSSETIPFLVKPGDALISTGNNTIRAYIAASWPSKVNPHRSVRSSRPAEYWSKNADPAKDKIEWSWSLRVWSYKYDGRFYREFVTQTIKLLVSTSETEVPIVTLGLYPARFAPSETKDQLEARGKTFWSCRKQRLVAYRDENGVYGGNTDRFMVDFYTYRQLHSDLAGFKRSFLAKDEATTEYISDERMEDDTPPSEPEIYVFSDTIIGYNLHKKKWVDLIVDRISDVKWNKQAFRSLVIDEGTKELVQALVTNQIAQEQGTDLIDGKGNGLIMLLHGSPGTGKTYTAEGVAEIAEKPLFRVTCGDIGTKPEDVEKYLESALHLGKSWGCVVLLDEADVFLEQRTLTDLDRNALVSVFLRVLEYYEGILILTSNRVGTFDEAFKSRIQLSLHYDNLGKPQRHKVWKNFLSRLKEMDANNSAEVTQPGSRKRKLAEPTGIDFDDIECYVEELAEYELNGRQIRNAITTARQLAKFQDKRMTHEHLKRVITVASKFDAYLKKVQDDFSDDQIARGAGIR